MKLKFKLLVWRSLVWVVGLLLWSVCVHGQNVPSTNAPANASVSVRLDSASRVTPILSTNAHLTFGLDGISFLQCEMPDGIPLWLYLATLIYVLLALIFSKLLDYLIGLYLKGWAERRKTRFGNLLLTLLHGPIKVISFVVFLHIGLQVLDWPHWVEDFLRKGLKIVVACSLTYMAVKIIDLFIGYWRQRTARETDRAFDEHLFPVINTGLKAFVIVVAVLVTSQNLGLNITGVIASLSIGGLALGLAAQDTLANLFGAVAVFIDKPFRIGDRVRLDSVEGTVEAIGLRSTRVRSLDGHFITIPNKTMGNAIITNVTRRPSIKTEMNLGLTYDTPTEKLKRALTILEEVYRGHPMTSDVIISFNKFADSSLNILVVHWWNLTDHKAYLAGMQELNLLVKKRFDEEGINFAFPTQTLYLKQDSDWRLNGLSPALLPAGSSADGRHSDQHEQP